MRSRLWILAIPNTTGGRRKRGFVFGDKPSQFQRQGYNRHRLTREPGKGKIMSSENKAFDPSIAWRGNKKMSWPTWSIPAVLTCPNRTPMCEASCYALKAERQYPNVLPARKKNLKLTVRADFVPMMAREIQRKNPKIFRIHESGDFYSKTYFLKWREIAELCPDTQFFAFTKVFSLFRFKLPDNFVLVASVFPDEKRKAPKNAPTFTAVLKGDSIPAEIQCEGSCDTCGICPFATKAVKVWCEIH